MQYKRTVSFLLILMFVLSLFSCSEGQDVGSKPVTTSAKEETTVEEKTDTATETAVTEPPVTVLPENGSTVSLLNGQMTEWLKNYKKGKLDKICDYTEKCEPVPVLFEWGGDADYTHLLLSVNADMSDAAVYLCSGDSVQIEDLLPGTEYFWQTVCTKDGKNDRSAIRSFKTLAAPRTVYIPGVSNVRDLGGKITKDGKRIKFGMVYRGADFAHLTEEGRKKAVDVLGIKTELDLRNKAANGRSPLGENIRYFSVTAPYYGNVTEESYKNALAEELRVFADPDNYPVYFHCSLGRDRTGTLAFFLLSLLGADETDILEDYEISFFSDMGGYVDTTAPSFMVSQLESLRKIVSKNKAKLYENTRAFLLEYGLTDEELDAIRANLLEDVK